MATIKKQKPETAPNPGEVPVWFIYAGKTDHDQHLYYILTDYAHNNGTVIAQNELKTFYTDSKIFSRDRIGYIHPVTLINDGKTVSFNKSAPVAGFWETESDLQDWQATAKAAEVRAAIKKRSDDYKLEQLLQPVRMQYKKQFGASRTALLAEVIRIITA